MKKVIQIVLILAILALAYVIYEQLMTPIRFKKEVVKREAVVIQRAKDIRNAEQAFRKVHQRYTASFDTLVDFVLNDSLTFEKSMGSKDDSVAVAMGLVTTEYFRIPVIDTIFGRKMTAEDVRQLPYIPFSDNQTFALKAGYFTTESNLVIPIFELKAHYAYFLHGLNQQEIINLVDERENTFGRYPGVKVGDIESATNDAGNWE